MLHIELLYHKIGPRLRAVNLYCVIFEIWQVQHDLMALENQLLARKAPSH